MSSLLSRIPTCLTLEPIPDESLMGYIFRLARYRGLGSGIAQMADCGIDRPTNQPTREEMDALAASASMPVRRLQAISYGAPSHDEAFVTGHLVRRVLLDRRGAADRRVCPACLFESAHHRAMWDLRYVAVCPVHGCELLDVCPSCEEPLKWRGADLARCPCGQGLDSASLTLTPVPESDVTPTAGIYGVFGDARFEMQAAELRNVLPLSDLKPGDLADFVFRLGLERMGRRKKIFSAENPGELVWEAHVVLRRGLEAFSPWPDEFLCTLDEMRGRWGSTPELSVILVVGAVERWLTTLPDDTGRHIRQVVESYRETCRNGKRPSAEEVT